MSFDARSLERLQQLGRSLPQPLPRPTPKATEAVQPSERRHPVEIEENPEALFRELMKISPDGSVPPHLLAGTEPPHRCRRVQRHSSATLLRSPAPQRRGDPCADRRAESPREQPLRDLPAAAAGGREQLNAAQRLW